MASVAERLALSLLVVRVDDRIPALLSAPENVKLRLLTLNLDKGWEIGMKGKSPCTQVPSFSFHLTEVI